MYFERRVLSSRTVAGVEAGLAWRLVALALSPASASMLNDVEHGRSDVTAHRLLRRSGRGLNGTVNVSMRCRLRKANAHSAQSWSNETLACGL